LPKDNIIKLMLSTAGCFLKKYESSAALLSLFYIKVTSRK